MLSLITNVNCKTRKLHCGDGELPVSWPGFTAASSKRLPFHTRASLCRPVWTWIFGYEEVSGDVWAWKASVTDARLVRLKRLKLQAGASAPGSSQFLEPFALSLINLNSQACRTTKRPAPLRRENPSWSENCESSIQNTLTADHIAASKN